MPYYRNLCNDVMIPTASKIDLPALSFLPLYFNLSHHLYTIVNSLRARCALARMGRAILQMWFGCKDKLLVWVGQDGEVEVSFGHMKKIYNSKNIFRSRNKGVSKAVESA